MWISDQKQTNKDGLSSWAASRKSGLLAFVHEGAESLVTMGDYHSFKNAKTEAGGSQDNPWVSSADISDGVCGGTVPMKFRCKPSREGPETCK